MMTQFVWPYLLSQFWRVFCHSGPLQSPASWCPCLPNEQTLTVNLFFFFFLSKRLGAFPQDWCLQSAKQFPLSCPMSQCTCATLTSPVTWNDGEAREFVIKIEAAWSSWQTTGDARCSDVRLQRVGLRKDSMMRILWRTHKTNFWSHKWRVMEVFNQGPMGATAESFHCSPESPHPSIQLVRYRCFSLGDGHVLYTVLVYFYFIGILSIWLQHPMMRRI